MLQKIIIDGYNVLHHIEAYKNKLDIELKNARELLIHDLKIYKSKKKVELLVVFDGSKEIISSFHQKLEDSINIIFSHLPQKADDVIMEMIRLEKQKGRITVVTEDREIIEFAKFAGSQCLSPQEFYHRIKTQSYDQSIQNKFEHDMTTEELEEWKRIFGIKDK